MNFSLELAHLQLTEQCNLRCPFCGQWGDKGFSKTTARRSRTMSTDDWIKAVNTISSISSETGKKTRFIIWGGEPLLFHGVEEILFEIKKLGCSSDLVTNGALLEKHAQQISPLLNNLLVSIDGPGEIHDQIRGMKNLHKRIERGISIVNSSVKKTALCVINEKNIGILPEIALYAESAGFDAIAFQNLIFMLPDEASQYDSWLQHSVGTTHSNSASWVCDKIPEFSSRLPDVYTEMEKRITRGDFKINVHILPKGISAMNVLHRVNGNVLNLPGTPPHCLIPFRHINVGSDGAIRFSIDFNELNLGSILDHDLKEILSSPKAKAYQKGVMEGQNPACKRCPWRYWSSEITAPRD